MQEPTDVSTRAGIRPLTLRGPAGRLEGLLNSGGEAATHAALVCHPHPLFGGTMHNKVVFHAMKALNAFGFPVLRFNFRGVGRSEGEHDYGRGEVEDVRTALDWLNEEYHLPIIAAGFSFGSVAMLRASCPDQHVKALISMGTPVHIEDRSYTYGFLESCGKPKLFVSGGRDEFGPRFDLERLVASVPEPRELVLIDGVDHFFAGKLDMLRRTIEDWVRRYLAGEL